MGLALPTRAEILSESKYSVFLGIQKADSAGSNSSLVLGVMNSTKHLSFARAKGTLNGACDLQKQSNISGGA
jgi:hypothetical protein